jgi:phosphoribosylformimino-5-aminoimidazole carboxamide ribotide isomerase
MKIIPVIDVKNGVVVHAQQGNREHYQPINTALCRASNIFLVIEAFLKVYAFDTMYLADLNAITHQGDNHPLLVEVLSSFPQITFWIDRGCGKNAQYPDNYLPVLGSESYRNDTMFDIKAYDNNFVLSLDYSHSNALGATNLFSKISLWPNNVIIMTLDRVGSNNGPDIEKLTNFCGQYPNKNFIAAGGIRDKEDLMALKRAGIHHALVASALHSGAIRTGDIAALAPCL